jgi:hypothetical protein
MCFITICIFFIQTLIQLHLFRNRIRDQGVKDLADALCKNKVNHILYLSILLIYVLLHTETHRTSSWMESNWRRRSKTSRRRFKKQRGELHSLLIYKLLALLFFYIEPHQTRSWRKPNRRERGKWSRQCFKRQHSKRHSITHLLYVMCTFFTQQLIQLDLSGNAIGDDGANHLAEILEKQTRNDRIKNLDVPLEHSNTVNHFLLATFFIIVCICSHRNSKSCTLAGTKLGTKEQNISPKFYARTRWDAFSKHFFQYNCIIFT